MYVLYAKRRCPYARAALGALHDAGGDFEVRYIEREEHLKKLAHESGGTQAPYFIDTHAHVRMSESGAIIAYLQEKHGSAPP